ncbi:hypothetical protein N0V90_006926 [Kalmusia sp. IMI 367209]|nr:hypothetical protein N0V90_006926 [Kalmusia sp. IMI 367209]
MAQPLTKFWPIFASKSDGRDIVSHKGTPLRNGPTSEQLDRTPNEQGQSDYYRLIEKDDAKHVDWRKKLGGMLLREIGGKQHEDKWQQCILWDFPEGYRLYEHIKSKMNGESKNHSGGGHDRQDAYLYGYPKGPRKRFRSPVEFFPHLLWLCTDEASDYNNCTCRICSPMQIEVEKPAPAPRPEVKLEKLDATSAARTMAAPNGPVPINRNPAPPVPIRRPSISTPIAQSPVTKPATPNTAQNATHIKPPPRLEPTPLPQPRSIDQQIDSQYGRFIARTGEVVWFKRLAGAFGLGLVARRWISKNHSVYLIQPLSYPSHAPAQEIVESEQMVKPWLAWSVPSCTYEWLSQNPRLTYEQVDWNMMASGRMGSGVPEVDASILAAKAIDITYTPFERLKTSANNGIEERHWNGIYYGAEKIWRGEPVRLRIGLGTDLLVISDIVEKVYPTGTAQHGTTTSKIEFRGDVYSYATLPAPNPTSPPVVPSNDHIPIRMREDMRWRNEALVPTSATIAYWKLVSAGTRIDLEDVKGRWYETSILFQEYFLNAVKSKEGGNGVWMNSRGDATSLGRDLGLFRSDRLAAFNNAIPKNLQLVDGLDPPADQQGLELGIGSGNGENHFALDDFMNFEPMEDPSMNFSDTKFY